APARYPDLPPTGRYPTSSPADQADVRSCRDEYAEEVTEIDGDGHVGGLTDVVLGRARWFTPKRRCRRRRCCRCRMQSETLYRARSVSYESRTTRTLGAKSGHRRSTARTSRSVHPGPPPSSSPGCRRRCTTATRCNNLSTPIGATTPNCLLMAAFRLAP